MQRYFVSKEEFNKLIINSDIMFHIKKVMRMKIGSNIIICYNSISKQCIIEDINDEEIKLKELKELKNNDLMINVTIAQGLPKGDKLDYIVQKSTELGVSEIILLEMENSIVKLDDKKKNKRLERLNKIAKEASEQSHRSSIPLIDKFRKLKNLEMNYDKVILCYEESSKEDELSNFKKVLKSDFNNILVIIGPEGGISKNEIEFLRSKNILEVGLGSRILRTETASSFVLSSIIYEKELK